MIDVGFTAASNAADQQLCAPVFAAVDYLEVVPESLVHPEDLKGFRPNGFFHRILELQQTHGVDLVGHGTGLSVCGVHPLDTPRLKRWLERASTLAERLQLSWYTDHAGITAPAGLNLTLPLDLPHVQWARDGARQRLAQLAEAVGVPVGIENSVFYSPMADPASEPAWLRRLVGEDHVLVLDLHNLWTHALNFGLDTEAWLAAAPLDRVIELHISGGTFAPESWTDGTPWRLDSHDAAVPEPVWELLSAVLPRCPNLRGVTLERLEGTVEAADVTPLLAEVARIRSILEGAGPMESPVAIPRLEPLPVASIDAGCRFELQLADAFSSSDPLAALQKLAEGPQEPAWVREAAGFAVASPMGIGLARRLVMRQRFERLVSGSAAANGWFEEDPSGFARAFAAYASMVPPTAYFPRDEAALFERWRRR